MNTTPYDTASGHCDTIFVARQAIFNTKMDILGYELLYRNASTAATAKFTDGNIATSKMIADGVALARCGVPLDKKIFINFTMNLIEEEFGFALNPNESVIEILETVEPTPNVIRALSKLKKAGYTLAVDDYDGREHFAPLLELADIIKVDMLNTPMEAIIRLRERITNPSVQLLAEKVEDMPMFQSAVEHGFTLFQGFFFRKPEIIAGKTISAGHLAKVNLIRELSDENYDDRSLSDLIKNDLSLAYKLLRYVNSALFGRKEHVDSIRHAIAILGQRHFVKWLQAVLLSNINTTSKGMEVMALSLSRANFMESIGPALGLTGGTADTLFILGLFSLLDSLLGVPMQEITNSLPLEALLKEALLGEDNDLGRLLTVAKNLEAGEWGALEHCLTQLGISGTDAAEAYRAALIRTGCLMQAQQHGQTASVPA